MVERPQRGKKKHKLLGNHQRSWLWGRHLVTEVLSAGRWPMLELYLADDLPEALLESTRKQIAGTDCGLEVVSRERLGELSHTSEHQGFLARVGPYPYLPPEELLKNSSDDGVWLVLVGIQDPHNLGAILRSAEVFGVTGVFLGEHGQTGINTQVARSSAGAVNRLKIARVPEFLPLLDQLRALQIQTIATTLASAVPLADCKLTGHVALLVGNEGTGLPEEILAHSMTRVRIPQTGTLNSLNVAAATAVCLYEIQRQRLAGPSR
ncbi:MAG: 23S rRNA (guanosine(2251)-2'-O)-methyltransferase RlmB [Planctomycetales bacterium]